MQQDQQSHMAANETTTNWLDLFGNYTTYYSPGGLVLVK